MSAPDEKLTEKVGAALAAVPYARFLGVEVVFNGDEMTAILPFSQRLIGNPLLPAIHGGVLGAFMELTAIAQLSALQPLARRPRTIDLSVEYLRSGRPLTTYARAEVKKVGRRVANVHVEAWQEQRAEPITFLRAHFLVDSETWTD
jgi:uncharacterized protein (TIGR00369 family)